MSSSATCTVINTVDKKPMTICCTWSHDEITVLVMRRGLLPLKGSLSTVQFGEFGSHFGKTASEYFEEVKSELSGDDKEPIQFILNKNVLSWKKTIWNRCKISCEPLEQAINLSDFLMDILVENFQNGRDAKKKTQEIEQLKKRLQFMDEALKEMTAIKNTMEVELCKQFLVLLNSKKRKIRELREEIKKLTKHPVYDHETEVSENDDASLEEEIRPRKKIKNDINDNNELIEASTSKDSAYYNMLRAIDEQAFSPSSPESIHLHYESSQVENHAEAMINNDDKAEDSDKDMFSDNETK